MKSANRTTATRRSSLRSPIRKPLALAAASLMLSAAALPAAAAQWWHANPSISIGSASVNVKNKGALGNGSHNDTAAFQAAVNALPSTGGTVVVPAGKYMIDAVKSVRLRSHVRLLLRDGAQLVAIPNSAGRYAVVSAVRKNNIEIVGGEIIGERARHRGTWGEWGFGINLLGVSKAFVHNIKLSNCWGDGLYIGGQNTRSGVVPSSYVTVNHVVSTGNRRQGLSITPANHIYVVNSSFTNTHGTLPQSGIDIEPQNMGHSRYVRIENTVMSGNRGNGLEVHNHVDHLGVVGSTLSSNRGFGVYAGSPFTAGFNRNTIRLNGLQGVSLAHYTHDVRLRYNTIKANSTRYISPSRSGGGLARDFIRSGSTYNISLTGNNFTN